MTKTHINQYLEEAKLLCEAYKEYPAAHGNNCRRNIDCNHAVRYALRSRKVPFRIIGEIEGRDHSTICNSTNQTRKLIAVDAVFKNLVEALSDLAAAYPEYKPTNNI